MMSDPQTTIALSAGEQVTLINVFSVDPSRQGDLVEALDRATVGIFVTAPGFISANLHSSLDGTRVINYVQWTSESAFRTALARADVREHLAEVDGIAISHDPTLVRVRAIHRAHTG